MLLIASLVSATSATAPSSPITVKQGDVFLLRGSITFDKADTGYFWYGPVYWYNYGNEDENFTLENTPSVYWSDGTPVENVSISDYAIPNGWQVDICDNGDGIERNGTFYVDIYLRAKGLGGILHAPGSQDIYFAMDQITMFEPSQVVQSAGPIVVNVTALSRGVDVSVSPSLKQGWTGDNLPYTVVVKNTGEIPENFKLTLSEDAGWPHGGIPDNAELTPSTSWTGQLWVVVSGSPGSTDNLTVTAKTMDNAVENSATCQAHNAVAGVDVTISPPSMEESAPRTYDFTVYVKNNGDKADTFDLGAVSALGWTVSLDNIMLGPIPVGDTASTTLHVTMLDVPLGTTDNIDVTATSQANNTVSDVFTCTLTRTIARGVQVGIYLFENIAGPGENVTFRVTVTNTGGMADNYVLTKRDNAGWGPTLSENLVNVENKENRTVTLTVTIPTGAENRTCDNVIVTATSQTDNTVENSASCTARVMIVRGIEVQVTPKVQENVRRENVAFTIKVVNTGNAADNFNLSWSDTENWGGNISLLENVLRIRGGDENTTTLRVHIPENAVPSTEDNITVTATSRTDNTIKDNDSCIVCVTIARGVRISISPGENSAFPGRNVTFTVTVTNTGDNADNYVLYASDNLRWGLSLADNSVQNVAPGGSRTTKLTVSIPENAAPDTRDNVTVTATSRENEKVTDNATCIAHSTAITRGVGVSISPAEEEGMQGSGLSYTVAVTNTGNVADNYDLTVSDNADWGPSISEDTLEVPAGENRSATLSVTVPDNAAPGTGDRITVTATSQENGAITASASCVGRALLLKRVEVRISPGYRSGSPEDTLYFTVKVTNAGRAADSFNLRTSASGGWLSHVEPSSLALDPGEFDNVTLSVLIPSDVREGDTGIVEVRTVSTTDPLVQGADTCRVIVFGAKAGVALSIPWIQIIIIAALIVGAVFTVGYITRKRGRGRRRGILRKVSA